MTVMEVRNWVFGVMALLFLASYRPALGQNDQGISATADAPRTVVLRDLPAAMPWELAAHPPIRRPMDGLSDQEYRELKEQVARKGAGQPSTGDAVPSPGNGGMLTPGAFVSFFAMDQATACPGCTPSDMGLAVGTTAVVEAINVEIDVYDKTGVTQVGFPQSLNAFFGVPATDFTTDPRLVYDRVNDRFFLIMLDIDGANNRGFLLFAASQSGDPTAGWWVYPPLQVGNSPECPDYPTLGQDHTTWTNESTGAFYIGFNMFANCSPTAPFRHSELFLFPKSPIYAGQGFTFWDQFGGWTFRESNVDTIQPVNVNNFSDQPRAEFLVNTLNINFGGGQCRQGCNGLLVWAVSNPFGFLTGGPGPEFSNVFLPTGNTYRFPTNAHAPNCMVTGCIETIDTRISGSINYTAGSIYAAWETNQPGGGPENSPIWVELHPILNDNDNARCPGGFECPQVTSVDKRQEDCYICGGWAANGSAYFGTLQPDPEGNVTMVFNFSNDNIHPGTAYVSRRVTQANSTMHDAGIFLSGGFGAYSQFRWGDYTATALDLTGQTQPGRWFAGMYAKTDGTWGTAIGANGFTAPNQP